MRRKARREREVRQLQMQFLRAPSQPVRVAAAHVWRLHFYLMKFKSNKDRQFRELDRRELLGAPRPPARAPSLTTPVPRVHMHSSSCGIHHTQSTPPGYNIHLLTRGRSLKHAQLLLLLRLAPLACTQSAFAAAKIHAPQSEGRALSARRDASKGHRHTASPHVIHHMLVDHRERRRRGVRRSSLPCPFDMEQPPRPAPEG